MRNKLIIFGIALIIIIVGIIMAYTTGFDFGIAYSDTVRMNIYMNSTSSIEDVEQIVKEIFDGKYEIGYTDEFSDTISINAKGMTDEQITQLKEKLREKYNFSEDTENVIVINTAKLTFFEIVKEYIKPIVITMILALIYFIIAFRKLGIFKSIILPILTIIMINALYISVLAIAKIEINQYTISLGVFIYIVSLMCVTICLSKQNKKIIS